MISARGRLVKLIEELQISGPILADVPMANRYRFSDLAETAAKRTEEEMLYESIAVIDSKFLSAGISVPALPEPRWAKITLYATTEEALRV